MMLSLLFLALSGQAATPAARQTAPNDPPIHVWFNSDGDYHYLDRAKVYAKSADNGYMVVLRADMNGRVRVLFPVDPNDDQGVKGGKKYELKGRGGREAFVAEDSKGQGTVLAAFSLTPFRFDGFAKDGHWDVAALTGRDQKLVSDDAEARLLSVVHDMQSADGHFEYDVANYVVSPQPRYARLRPYPYGFGWWGWDPWWGYGPVVSRGFWFGPRRLVLGGRWHY